MTVFVRITQKFTNNIPQTIFLSNACVQLCLSHRLLDLTAEDVDAEDLRVVVALGKGNAVALRRAVVAANAEEDLVNGVVGNLSAGLRVQQPDETFKCKMIQLITVCAV